MTGQFKPNAIVLVGSISGDVQVWNATTGQSVFGPFKAHTDRVLSVAFSHDDNFIVSGSDDKTVRLWDANTGQCTMGPLRGHTTGVYSVAFSHDGALLFQDQRTKRFVSGQPNQYKRHTMQPQQTSTMTVGSRVRMMNCCSGSHRDTASLFIG